MSLRSSVTAVAAGSPVSVTITSAVSSSVTVTVIESISRPVGNRPPSPPVTAWVISTSRLSPALSMSSFTPCTVTVWAWFQFAVVNVTAAVSAKLAPPPTLTSAPSGASAVTVTLAAG